MCAVTRTTPFFGVLFLALGCAPKVDQPCSRRVNSVAAPTVPVVLSGAPVTVSVELPIIVVCDVGPPQARSVVTSVLDVNNLELSHTATPPATSTLDGYSTDITFTPSTGGVYTITTTFEPALGTIQRQVQVVGDRTHDAPLAVLSQAACTAVSQVGTALACQHADSVDVYRDGGVIQSVPGHGMVAADQVLWVWGNGIVNRLEEVGPGPLQVRSATLAFPDQPSASRAATSTRLMAVVNESQQPNPTYAEVALSGESLQFQSLSLPTPLTTATSGLLALSGGEVAYGAAGGQLCVVTLSPLAANCRPVQLDVFAAEGDALWVRGVDNPGVGFVRVVAQEPSLTLLTARADPVLVDTQATQPFFRWVNRAVFPRLPDLVLETWAPSLADAKRLGVGRGVVWFADAAGTVTVYAR